MTENGTNNLKTIVEAMENGLLKRDIQNGQ